MTRFVIRLFVRVSESHVVASVLVALGSVIVVSAAILGCCIVVAKAFAEFQSLITPDAID